MITLPFPFATADNDVERIANSMAALDAVLPGWESKIDLDTLNLFSTTECVLGQLFGRYTTALNERRPALGGDSFDQDTFVFWTANQEWKDAIRARLSTSRDLSGDLRKAVEAMRAAGYTVRVSFTAPAPVEVVL